VIDHDLIERTLGVALRTGAEFAEIYAEDKRSTSVGLDDGRIEQVTSGRYEDSTITDLIPVIEDQLLERRVRR